MTGAPSPTLDIPDSIARTLESSVAAEYAYFTPKGDPLCWPVTPFWYPERGVLAIATGLAYPNKADYAKVNSKVALCFSNLGDSRLRANRTVVVQGDAKVLDQDIQKNTDRYVRELRRKFGVARIGLNSISIRFMSFYLPRLWVEITPVRILVYASASSRRAKVIGRPIELPARNVVSAIPKLNQREAERLAKVVQSFRRAVATLEGRDGYPVITPTPASPRRDGNLALDPGLGQGRACLTFHRHALGGTLLEAYIARGTMLEKSDGRSLFVPERLVPFFGNGFFFPFSLVPHMAKLRRRLMIELEQRGQPMPKLRV
jgi:hypothetical protein